MGYYKDEEHLKWILGNNDKGTLVYNVRLDDGTTPKRDGAHSESFYNKQNVKFVILYTDDVEKTGKYRVFHVKDTAKKVTEERMRGTWYPSAPQGSYYFYRFDEEVTVGEINITKLYDALKREHFIKHKSYTPCEPLFTTAEEVLKYIP